MKISCSRIGKRPRYHNIKKKIPKRKAKKQKIGKNDGFDPNDLIDIDSINLERLT